MMRSAQLSLLPYIFDGPQQAAGFVEADVVGPGIERRKTLVAGARAALAIGHAVGTGGVPGHAHHQAAVVAPVGGATRAGCRS